MAEGSLYSEDGAVIDVVGRVQRELIRLSGLDERLGALSGAAASVLAELEDLSRELGKYGGGLTADPERVEQVEDRIDQIKRLTRKHGGSVKAVLEAREEMARELDELENDEVRRADLTAALEAAEEERGRLARELSAARHRVVRALEKAISSELADLSMERTRVAVELVPLVEPNGTGAESAEIRISPNVGEPLRPLKKTASGGELSRVLLAIKHVLAHKSEVSTYVFDEVDAGIGGAVAEVVGAKLKGVAETSQILCVTHLPQVASFAERHLQVQKRERAGRTLTEVVALDERDRVEELARMLGGVEITDKTRSLAAEMRHRGSKGGNGRAAPRT
jgi:DNA repair protein RecN (Recombination protein N)